MTLIPLVPQVKGCGDVSQNLQRIASQIGWSGRGAVSGSVSADTTASESPPAVCLHPRNWPHPLTRVSRRSRCHTAPFTRHGAPAEVALKP